MDFRGASAESLAALTQVVAGAPAKQLAAVADELFSLSGVMRSEPALRRTLTDPSVAPTAKQALVSNIFTGKLSKVALEVVTSAAGRRWTSSRDLANALERLSEIAHVKSSGDPAALTDELFGFGQAIAAHPELRDALADPNRSAADRAALVERLLAKKASAAAVSLGRQAVLGSHRTVSGALAAYQLVIASVREQGVATVRVARPLSAEHAQRLAKALAKRYGHAVHLNVVVDPTVVGGISVSVGDDVIDGSISTRLATAGRQLAG